MRLYTIVVSIVAHAAALILLVVVPLVAMDAFPLARQATEFVRAIPAELPDVPPPPRGGNPPPGAQPARQPAPIAAGDHIAQEVAPPSVGLGTPIGGPDVPGGMPDGIRLPDLPADPPPPAAMTPIRPGGVIRPPTKIRNVAPVYPAIAQANHVEGTVILDAVIGENGRVRDVRVLRSLPLLDRAALDAVRQWQFTPTLLNGEPVPVVMTVTVTFMLSK